jgi:hypothetical protein
LRGVKGFVFRPVGIGDKPVTEQVSSYGNGRFGTNGRFRPGESANPSGRPSRAQRRALILAKAHELAEPIGGFENLNSIERELIQQAAEMLRRRPRNQVERVKISNLVSRILRDALRRHRSDKSPKDGLGDYLRRSA